MLEALLILVSCTLLVCLVVLVRLRRVVSAADGFDTRALVFDAVSRAVRDVRVALEAASLLEQLLKSGVERIRFLGAGDFFNVQASAASATLGFSRHTLFSLPATHTLGSLVEISSAFQELRVAVASAFNHSARLGSLEDRMAVEDMAEDDEVVAEKFFYRIRDLEQSMAIDVAVKQIEVSLDKLLRNLQKEFPLSTRAAGHD